VAGVGGWSCYAAGVMARDRVNGANDECELPILRVLHVADGGAFTRFGRMFRQLGLALPSEGVRMTLLTDDPVAVADLDGTPVDVQAVDSLNGWGAWGLRAYLRRQFDPPPDVVHVWGTASLGALRGWADEIGAPLLIYVSSQREVERLRRRSLRPGEWVGAACEEYGEMLRARWPTLAGACRVLRPCVLMPARVRELAVRDKTLGIVWAGTVDKHSGLEVLVEAAAQLRSKDVDFQVALLGRGPATGHIWSEIRRRRVQDRFSLIAEPHLWDQAMAGADVCVVPACQQELSLAPLLAMAEAKVVVASRDQVADWFIEDETSLQFTPGSAVELAYHVTRTAVGHPNVLALARSAAEYVRANHAVTRLVEELAEVYRSMVSAAAEKVAANGDGE